MINLSQDINLQQPRDEQIHLNAKIQSHGVLLVLKEPELIVLQASANTANFLGITPEDILNQKLENIFDTSQIEKLKTKLEKETIEFINPAKLSPRKKEHSEIIFDGIFHRNIDGFLILELEPMITIESIHFLEFYHIARDLINELRRKSNLQDFCQIIIKEVRKLTGFDRVMLYKFDEDSHGEVIAEDKLEELETYLGLHYPESDIPAVARQFFHSNWIRLIANTKSQPIDLYPQQNPLEQKNTNLSFSTLRSSSPCHLEYLQNIGVGASLTISLIKDGQLWGLIACHHRTPKYISYELRKACEFLGQVVFSEIAVREETEDYNYRMKLAGIQSQLIDYMSQENNFVHGLVNYQPNLLDLTNAQGAAICFDDQCILLGKTPLENDLKELLQWLKNNVNEEIFYTNSLPKLYANAQNFKEFASGLLVLPISKRNFVLWFRPEVMQTVNWGGNPHQPYEVKKIGEAVYLSPRKSFKLWQEIVQLKSLPWKQIEINAALQLKKAIVNIILKQAEQLSQLAQDLERSNANLKKFAYVVSHDLQEPLNQVANYVQLLEMRYREQLDEDADEFITFAVEGVNLMQTLIDDILVYSKVDMQAFEFKLTNSETSLERALVSLRGKIKETGAIITHNSLPIVMADGTQLMQLFQNLISNAIKFCSGKTPEIQINAERIEDAWLFSVKDNGIGINPQFFERIFVIFQRLHTREEYSGTGMGLAICKKIIECHRGKIWVKSKLEQGSTFYFTIPLGAKDHE